MALAISPAEADAALLDVLTGPNPHAARSFARRDAVLDPLLLAAAAASGPHVTRNHYHHDFFPGVMLPKAEAAWDWTKFTPDVSNPKKRLTYVSRQAPRRQRLVLESAKENVPPSELNPPDAEIHSPPTVLSGISPQLNSQSNSQSTDNSVTDPLPPLEVKCMARTRVPTPHGPIFLHLYHNNRDNKEHLAFVVDPAQLSDSSGPPPIAPPIRSRSLDAVWSDTETEMDRIVRGAYQGRLSQTSQRPSRPVDEPTVSHQQPGVPPPLIRIHSECFTGETVGSMRCDCGEQLDEAIRRISQPISVQSGRGTIPGRGAVIYLRQEGRGIGLLSKIRAYNLQDMGHDTVTANLMLGHKADERAYDIAAGILRDLGLGDERSLSEGVRVLTNNPDKMEALEKEGIRVVERVPMVPRSWQLRKSGETKQTSNDQLNVKARIAGATLIGGGAVYGEDLDKYLVTKVQRMGHMLPLWLEDMEDGY